MGPAGGTGRRGLLWLAGPAEPGVESDDSEACGKDPGPVHSRFRCQSAFTVLHKRGHSGVAGAGHGGEDER